MTDLLSRLAALDPDRRAALLDQVQPAGRRTHRTAPDETVPATPAQTRIWLQQRLDPDSPLYNLAAGLRLRGPLDTAALRAALTALVHRHETLRTRFPAVAGLPVQVVAPPSPVDLPVVDLGARPAGDRDELLSRLCRDQGRRPFDLDTAPLARFTLVRLGAEDHFLLLVVHHLVSDGWSFAVFARELAALYQAAVTGGQSPLRDLSVQFRDLVDRGPQPPADPAADQQLAWWTDLLAGAPPALELPTDRPRPPVRAGAGRLHRFVLPVALTAAVEERAARARQTPFSILLSAFGVLLQRLSGQDQVVVGVPVAGRTHPGSEDLVGMFVNTLPLRLDLAGAPSHAEVASRVQRLVVGALAHQEVPFDRIVRALRPPRDPSRPVLRQVAFAFQTPPTAPRIGPLSVRTVTPMEIDLGLSRLDLTLHLWVAGGRLHGSFEYDTDLFDAATVARWAGEFEEAVRGAVEAPDRPVRPAGPVAGGRAAEYDLTGNQLLFWFGKQRQPDVRLYFEHITTLFAVPADLDAGHLRRAFATLVRFSDSLRSVFRERDGVPRRLVRDAVPVELDVVDLSGRPDPDAALERWVAQRSRPDLDLGQRVFDTALLRLGPGRSVWYLNVHHLVSDAWSTSLILRYVSDYYLLSREGRLADAVAPPPYADYLQHEREARASDRYARAARHWRDKLAEPAPRLGFYERGSTGPGTRTARVSVDLGPERTRRIRELARREGLLSPAVVFGTALFTYLYRASGEGRLRIGTPFANRPTAFRDTIGLFMNACPLQVQLDGAEDFRTLARRVQVEFGEAGRHQEHPVRHPPDGRLYDVYLNFQNAVFTGFGGPVEVRIVGTPHSNDLLSVQVRDFARSDRFTVDLDFAVHAFGPDDRDRTAAHLVSLLDELLDHPGRPIAAARMLSAAEEEQVLRTPNRTARPYPLDIPLHRWVQRQVERTPEAVAVVFEQRRLTYRQLDEAANRVARRLRELGVGADVPVGVCLRRSPEMVVALLGVLKAGGAYLPLDPESPGSRLQFMAEDADVPVVLTQRNEDPAAPRLAQRSIALDVAELEGSADDPRVPVEPDDLAYVLYTSGSTGRPKGVMIPHRGICNRLLWMQEAYGLGPADRVLQKTPFGFDVSVWEFFWPLMTGARLVLARPGGHQDPAYLADLIVRERITTVHFVPSMLRAFLGAARASECRSLRRVVCSGEALPADLVAEFFRRLPGSALQNLYGPTEASVDVTHWTCPPGERPEIVPIGTPIANTEVYVLDRHLNPVPPGLPGELHLGGVGLARGYLNRPELTAEKFVPHPFSTEPGARLYRTGDLTRQLPGGTLEFLGRLDDQVKIRGVRLELGEVEAELARHPQLRAAAAAVRSRDGDPTLVGYVVPRGDRAPADRDLREFLAARLPEAMVPTAFVPLPDLPLTTSGKLDRKALPDPTPRAASGGPEPRTELEELIAGVWADELGLARVAVHDDFFEVGGHSLAAARMVAALGRRLGTELPLATVFRARTVAALAELLSGDAGGDADLLVPLGTGGDRPALFAVHAAGGEVVVYRHLAAELGGRRPLVGVQSRAVAGGRAEHPRIELMAAEYARAIRRSRPSGPYHLLGWSMGGAVAVGVARELEDQGEQVAFVGLLDAHLPPPGARPDPLLAPAAALADSLAPGWGGVDAAELDALRRQVADLPLPERLRAVTGWARERGLLAGDLPAPTVLHRAELAAAHEELLLGHRAPTVAARLHVWWAETSLDRREHPRTDWSRHTRSGVVEETLPGDHFSLLRPPHCTLLAARLHKVLATPGGQTGPREGPRGQGRVGA